MSFDKYPAYKSSSLKWLGDIPESWELKRLKHLFSLVKRPVQEGNGIVTCFRDGTVTLRSKRRTEGFTNAVQEIGYQGVRAGDLVIHAMDAFAGAIGVSDSDGKSSPVYSVCVPKSQQTVLTEYYGKLLRNMALSGFVASLAKGIRERSTDFRWSDAGEIFLPVPSIHEQTQIAHFLDHETAKIDALIREQERLIELLQEKRQAVISHAVTKGVDPDVPMKDSGVEWLGEVPAHWEMVPLKHLCSFSGGGTPSKEKLEYWNGDIPWVSPKDMKSFWVSNSIDKITELAVAESSTSLVEPNALLMVVRSGILQRTIPIAINTVEVTLNQDMKALRFSMEGFERYFAMLVQGFEPSWLLEWRKQGATVESIEQEYLAESLIPVPPRDEMYAIVNKLAAVAKQYESLEDEAHKSSKLLRERRSALISAAVTGKIDVRNWQPPTDESAFDEEVPQAGMETTA